MNNKILKEYINEINNKEYNYNMILSRMEKIGNIKSYKKKVMNVAVALVGFILVGTISTQIYAKINWEINFKEYKNRDYKVGYGSITEWDYEEEIDMNYITQNGISSKVNSLVLTDDHLEAIIDFKFDDEIKLDSEKFSFGYAIYDDENNIYGIASRVHIGTQKKGDKDTYTPYLYEELGVKYNKNDVYTIQLNDTNNLSNILSENRNIKSKIEMESKSEGFPRSKKIYIRIFDLGFSMVDLQKENKDIKIKQAEDFTLSNLEWIFEIEVPEKFYNRETVYLKLKDKIPGFELEKASITETGLVIRGSLIGFDNLSSFEKHMDLKDWKKIRNETINITDEEGNEYYEQTEGTLQSKDKFKMSFQITKNMLNKKLFLNIKSNGKQYTSELIEV